jgi:regulator of replication initiation timing
MSQDIDINDFLQQLEDCINSLIAERNMLRDDWKAMIKQIEDLEHNVKNLRRGLERERTRNAVG